MGRNDFLKKVERDIQTFSQAYTSAKSNIPLRVNLLKQVYGLKYKLYNFNFKILFRDVINDNNISYSFGDFDKDMIRLNKRADNFKDVAFDLAKIKELVNKNELKDATFVYIALKLYSGNFDMIINLLRPMAEKIQAHKRYKNKYSKNGKDIKVSDSATTLLLFESFKPRFYSFLKKSMNRRLRNAIAHEQWVIKNGRIYYEKGKWINRESLFKKTVLIGHIINQLQLFQLEQEIKIYTEILDKKMTRKQAQAFIETYKV